MRVGGDIAGIDAHDRFADTPEGMLLASMTGLQTHQQQTRRRSIGKSPHRFLITQLPYNTRAVSLHVQPHMVCMLMFVAQSVRKRS